MRTIDDMIRQEVIYCVSGMVHTLATEKDDEQAMELFLPVLDYESAALEAGWTHNTHNGMFVAPIGSDIRMADYDDWQELCEENDIEPHEREIFEHWIVTDWLAEKLEAKGERVDMDFMGLTIWARTTTGQGIAMDSVIAEIYADCHKD